MNANFLVARGPRPRPFLFQTAVVLATMWSCLSASPGHAGLMLSTSSVGGTSVSGAVGDSLSIPIYLRQTDTTTILTDEGLQSFGVAGSFDNSALSITAITLNPSFSFSPVTAFDNGLGSLSASGGKFFASVIGNSIWLATIDVDLLQVGTTTLSLADLDNRFPDFASAGSFPFLGQDLDPILFGVNLDQTQDFTITATGTATVPEPASTTLLIVAGAALMTRRKRRRPGPIQATVRQ